LPEVSGEGLRSVRKHRFESVLIRVCVHANTYPVSITPQALQDLLDELEASRASRKRAWENLQEIRWVLKDISGMELPPPARKTIDLEGRVVKDGVRTALRDRQDALSGLVEAIRKYRKLAEKTPLTLQGADCSSCRGTQQGD
jgi:hypothetical protein